MKRLAIALLALMDGLLGAAPPFAIYAAEERPAETSEAPEAFTKAADEVAHQVETLRGWKFKTPVKKALCEPDYICTLTTRDLDEDYPNGKVNRIQAALRMLGLLPEDCDLLQTYLGLMESQIGGFYDPKTQTFYLVRRDPDATYDDFNSRVVMAHELTHALDDQYFDLRQFMLSSERTEDADMTRSAVVEGSATVLMMRYMIQFRSSDKGDSPDADTHEAAEQAHTLLNSPLYFQTIMAPYTCGMKFLIEGNPSSSATHLSEGLGTQVRAAAQNPPASFEQILHPEKYWDPAKQDPPVTATDTDVEKAITPPGYHVIYRDTYGEAIASLLTRPKYLKASPSLMDAASYWITPAASGWGGDRFYLLGAGPTADEAARNLKDLKGVWVTLWDTPKDRDEFLAAYHANGPTPLTGAIKLGTLGAVFFFEITSDERQAAEEALNTSPLTFRHGQKPWAPWAL